MRVLIVVSCLLTCVRSILLPTTLSNHTILVDHNGKQVAEDCSLLDSHLSLLKSNVLATPLTSVAGNGTLCFSRECDKNAKTTLSVDRNLKKWSIHFEEINIMRGTYSEDGSVEFDRLIPIDSISKIAPDIINVLEHLCGSSATVASKAYLASQLSTDAISGTLRMNVTHWTLILRSNLTGTQSSGAVVIDPSVHSIDNIVLQATSTTDDYEEFYSHYHENHTHNVAIVIGFIVAIMFVPCVLYIVSEISVRQSL